VIFGFMCDENMLVWEELIALVGFVEVERC